MTEPMWTLEGVRRDIIAILQPVSRAYGYHVVVGGGCLNNGQSDKDADIYFLPLDNGKQAPNPEGVAALLGGMWGNGLNIGGDEYPLPPTSMYAAKLKFNFNGRRVDVFIMKGSTVGQE